MKNLFLALALSLSAAPAWAQAAVTDFGFTAGAGSANNTDYRTTGPQAYADDSDVGNPWVDVPANGTTGKQDPIWFPLQRANPKLPPIIQSGAATGAPILPTLNLPGSPLILGTKKFAPANLALRGQGWNGPVLPETTLDSFVECAEGEKYHIYGDEGEDSIPPYFGFDEIHRIEHGIYHRRQLGLTTGHKSDAPSAWDYPQ